MKPTSHPLTDVRKQMIVFVWIAFIGLCLGVNGCRQPQQDPVNPAQTTDSSAISQPNPTLPPSSQNGSDNDRFITSERLTENPGATRAEETFQRQPKIGTDRQDDVADYGEPEDPDADEHQFELSDEQTIEIPDSWKRLGKHEIWVDFANKQVIIGGYICLNVGALEMFACPAGTKEHESIVAANALASEMHAALIAVGGEPGEPCNWDETSFTPASGSIIEVDVRWRDEKTQETITRSAKEMMKTSDEKIPDIDWVFGGSRFMEDLETKSRYYIANSGEMICVSNFSTAAIDLNIVSSQTNEDLLFWANTENIPPRGTKVYLMLKPGKFVKPAPELFETETAPADPQSASAEAAPNADRESSSDNNK